jgi:hypothetical protein
VNRLFHLLAAALATLFTSAAFGAAVTVTAPAAGTQVSGAVTVAATVVPGPGEPVQRPVVVLPTGRQLRMSPTIGDTYSVEVDTKDLPNGRQSLMVMISNAGAGLRRTSATEDRYGKPDRSYAAELPVIVRNPYRFLWGDLHAHTSYSDGLYLPEEAYQYAHLSAKLDFFAVTDHSQYLTTDEYADIVAQADKADEPGTFAALYGVEETEGWGHINYFMAPDFRLPIGLDAFYRALDELHLIGHYNHPGLTSDPKQGWKDDFQRFHYVPEADAAMAMVEVREPKEEAAYIALLDAGWHVGAAGDEDRHEGKWGSGPTWTVALARSLTRDGVLDALRARRTYSTADRDLQLTFTVDGEDMGARIARSAGKLSCAVDVLDADGDAIDSIALFVDGKVAQQVAPGVPRYSWSTPVELAPGSHYLFLRLTLTNGHQVWSSPVWVNAYGL